MSGPERDSLLQQTDVEEEKQIERLQVVGEQTEKKPRTGSLQSKTTRPEDSMNVRCIEIKRNHTKLITFID